MLLLHLPLSFSFCSNPGPPRMTRRRPCCHFRGLYIKTLPHFHKSTIKTVGSFEALVDPHIAYPPMKTKGTIASKKCHQHYCMHRRVYGRSATRFQDMGRKETIFLYCRSPKCNQHEGLFRLFQQLHDDEGAVVNSPLTVKHKVSGSEKKKKGNPDVHCNAAATRTNSGT